MKASNASKGSQNRCFRWQSNHSAISFCTSDVKGVRQLKRELCPPPVEGSQTQTGGTLIVFPSQKGEWVSSSGPCQSAFYGFTPIKNQLPSNLSCPSLSCRRYQIHILNDCRSGLARIVGRWTGCWERTHTLAHPVAMESEDGRGFSLREQVSRALLCGHPPSQCLPLCTTFPFATWISRGKGSIKVSLNLAASPKGTDGWLGFQGKGRGIWWQLLVDISLMCLAIHITLSCLGAGQISQRK